MQPSDKSRYSRIPGAERRYLDRDTGSSISRRQYIIRTSGLPPEVHRNQRYADIVHDYRLKHPEKSLRQARKDLPYATAVLMLKANNKPVTQESIERTVKSQHFKRNYSRLTSADEDINRLGFEELGFDETDFHYVASGYHIAA